MEKGLLFNKMGLRLYFVLICSVVLFMPLSSIFAHANDPSPPIISGISHDVTSSSVNIMFSTDVESFGEVKYWVAGGEEQTASFSSSSGQLDHDVTLPNLQQGNVYVYSVRACTSSDSCRNSDISYFVFGNISTPPPVDSIHCPTHSRDRFVQIGGTTRPMSEISLYQDGSFRLKVDANEEGLFVLQAPLTSQPSTELKLVVKDLFGNENEKVCVVSYDSSPPILDVDSIPSMTDELRVDLSLSVNKPVTLEVFRFDGDESQPPNPPTNLRLSENPTSEKIVLEWNAPEKTDHEIQSYIIYRGNIPIAYTSASQREYEDTQVISGRSYSYRVVAVDSYCNKGEMSEVLDATVKPGNHYSSPPERLNFLCPARSPDVNTNLAEDSLEYSGPLTLRDGNNRIKIIVTDSFGNTASKEFRIEVDRTKPTLDTNLDEFSTGIVFTPYVTIRGEVSKPATINITVNKGKVGERTYTNIDATSGTFSERIDLARSWEALFNVGDDPETAAASIDMSGREWESNIEIVAIDNFGNKVTETGKVTYGLCAQGDGHDWQITIPPDSVAPNEIIPRHLLEGMAVLGFSIELDYRGSGESPEIIETRVRPASISAFAARNYNLGWIRDSPIPVNRAGNYAYAQIRLQAQKPDPDGTLLENEQKIAETNKGRCFGSAISFVGEGGLTDFGSTIDFGCVKLPLVVEVQYRAPGGEILTQQECVDFSIMINNRLDVRDAPLLAPALNASSRILKTIADVADNLISRLQFPMRVSTIGCISSYALNFISMVGESRSCVLNGALAYVNDFEFVAQGDTYVINMQGLNDEQRERAEKLQSCFDAKVSTEKNWFLSKTFCKRVMCTSIPSFESYVNDQAVDDLASLDGIDPLTFLDQTNSYCYNRRRIASENGANVFAPDGTYPPNFLEAKVAHKDTVGETGFGPHERVVANFLYSASSGKTWAEEMGSEWCEEEYLYEYGPSCWLRNPYKDSLCTSFKNNREAFNVAGAESALGPICDGFLDNIMLGVSDFASKLNFCSADQDDSYVLVHGEDSFWVRPNSDQAGTKEVSLLRPEALRLSAREEESGLVRITDQQDLEQLRLRVSESLGMDKFQNLQGCPFDDAVRACYNCAGGVSGNSCCPTMTTVGRKIPPSIAREICHGLEPEQANIIDPTGNFIDSTACVCLTGVNAYLRQIADVSRMLSDCFETILLTGDGSAGVCQQIVSTYVCDLFYSAMGCFTRYAGAVEPEDEAESSFRNIGNALALAGRRTQDRIAGEYEDTALFNHLFVEKNFINSVCNFALFGEWPSNFFDTAFEATVDDVVTKPIKFCSGSRRFQTFDPTTGIATHMYDIASFIRSGAPDTTYKIELVCSTEHGSDCNAVGEIKRFDVTGQFGSGRLARSETLDKQAFVIVDESRDHANNGWYRYDQLRISTTYKNNDGAMVTEEHSCDLREEGGQAPAFCGFDLLDAKFICRVVGQEGSVYFAQTPVPKRNVIYLDDSASNRMVEFETYSVRVVSRPGQPQPDVRLRISVTDNNGALVQWTDGELGRGLSSNLFRITSQNLIRFGAGADSSSLDIPRFRVDKLDAFGGGTGRCRILYNDGTSQISSNCNGNFEAVEFRYDESSDRVTFVKGQYNADTRTFTDTGSVHTLPGETYDACVEGICNIEVNENDLNLDIRGFRVSGGSFVGKFPFVVVNAHSGRSISNLNVKFELIDDAGSVIQERTSQILIRSGTRDQDVETPIAPLPEDSTRTVVTHGLTCTSAECVCSEATCSMGQRCCGVDSHRIGGIGYCIPSSAQCDNLIPNLDDIEISVSMRNGFIDFAISNVKDESQSIQGVAPSVRLFIEMVYFAESHSSSDLPSLQPSTDSSFTSSASEPEGRGDKFVRTYQPITIPVVANDDGCYEVYVSAVDKAGNYNPRLPENSEPNGILIIDGGEDPLFIEETDCRTHLEG